MPRSTATATEEKTDEVKGTSWLAEHVNAETGSDYDGYGIRILLRKLTKDGVIERGEGRYTFAGPRDKTVLAVVKAVKSGSADKAKQERLDELKAKREAKKTAEPAPAAAKKAPSRRGKAAAAPVDEEAPAPRRRTRKAAAAPQPEEDEDLGLDEI